MHRLHDTGGFTACLAILLALTSCGGGGGASSGPTTESILIPVEADGFVTATRLMPWDNERSPLTSIPVGDDTENRAFRGLMLFPLADIPDGAEVVGARLLVQFLDRLGNPGFAMQENAEDVGTMGQMEWHRLAGTPLAVSDFDAPSLGYDHRASLFLEIPNITLAFGAFEPLKSALADADTHLKLRAQYQELTNGDGVLDQLHLGTRAAGEGAILEVIIRRP